MLVRRVSAGIIAALLAGLLLAVPAQALIVDDGGGSSGGGGGSTPAVITFDDQNGPPSVRNTQVGASVNPPTAQWSGHTLSGWFTEATGGTQVTFPYVVTGNSTFYAHWLNQYTVTFDEQNGAAPYGITADSGASVWPSGPTFAGHTFAGWWTMSTGGTQVTLPVIASGNATVYAHWTLNQYTVTFDATNGTGSTN